MVDALEIAFAFYLLVVQLGAFGLSLYIAKYSGVTQVRKAQEAQWYRTVGVVNGFVVLALCLLILLG